MVNQKSPIETEDFVTANKTLILLIRIKNYTTYFSSKPKHKRISHLNYYFKKNSGVGWSKKDRIPPQKRWLAPYFT